MRAMGRAPWQPEGAGIHPRPPCTALTRAHSVTAVLQGRPALLGLGVPSSSPTHAPF